MKKTLSEHTLCPVLQVDIASKRLSLFMVANRFVDVCKIGIQGKGFAKLLFFAVAKVPNLQSKAFGVSNKYKSSSRQIGKHMYVRTF